MQQYVGYRGIADSGAASARQIYGFITVIPGGFLLHLSSGIVVSLVHGYVWDKGTENKEAILAVMKGRLGNLQNGLQRMLSPGQQLC